MIPACRPPPEFPERAVCESTLSRVRTRFASPSLSRYLGKSGPQKKQCFRAACTHYIGFSEKIKRKSNRISEKKIKNFVSFFLLFARPISPDILKKERRKRSVPFLMDAVFSKRPPNHPAPLRAPPPLGRAVFVYSSAHSRDWSGVQEKQPFKSPHIPSRRMALRPVSPDTKAEIDSRSEAQRPYLREGTFT